MAVKQNEFVKQVKEAVTAINAKRHKEFGSVVRQGDGCTMVPDFNFRDCCQQHDMGYMNPATTRYQDDCALYKCIRSKTAWWNPIAGVYFAGVRACGASRYVGFEEYRDIGNDEIDFM